MKWFLLSVPKKPYDEWQMEVRPGITVVAGDISRQAIIDAGEYFNLRLPLDAEYKIGDNWKETH